jgi:hypothetical protein
MTRKHFAIQRTPGMSVSNEELLEDLRATAANLEKTSVGMKEYRQLGKYSNVTVSKRFGSWNNALMAAGITITREMNIPTERLFENILTLWQHYGRQPSKRQLAQPPSAYSERPYTRRFGSWWKALESFVEYANGTGEFELESNDPPEPAKRNQRDPSLRLRWKVLQRDRFTCRACGASPAITLGVELHVDHVIAWSNGGDTTVENLQTLCSTCNLGKSNL